MGLEYSEIFARNYGVFSREEQDLIRGTRVLIMGDSGSGEAVAVLLARCGIGRFSLYGQGSYEPSDMNRQPCCFTWTIGKRKIDRIKETILAVHPWAEVETHGSLPDEPLIDEAVSRADIVIPAVDDLPYSVLIFRSARRLGKPAVLCLPSGSMAWVSVFTKQTPTVEEVFGVPELDYPGLCTVIRTREYRCAQYNFITSGDWRVEWFWDYFLGKRPLALICAAEWLAAGLAAQETVKIASGKWRPVLAPACWYLRRGRVSRSRFSPFIKYHRKLGWVIFGKGIGRRLHRLTHLFWGVVFDFLRLRQKSRDGGNPPR